MGDAGPPSPLPLLTEGIPALDALRGQDAPPLREVKVLVTGFGPFKSFFINPSWLIASALPEELHPAGTSDQPAAYTIKLIIHPSDIRVSYGAVSTLVPTLVLQHDPDFIVHIGMAGGRDCYSLETRAHRDGYRIKDVDNSDGFSCGESVWKKKGVPDVLFVRWNEADVLARWEQGVQAGLKTGGFLGQVGQSELETSKTPTAPAAGRGVGVNLNVSHMAGTSTRRAEEHKKKATVRLSSDAGRFLCEYALFESLSLRWLDTQRHERGLSSSHPDSTAQAQEGALQSSSSSSSANPPDEQVAAERLGKVAFLHVPGWTTVEDVSRGVMIAEQAIRALVASWEGGLRRSGSEAPSRTSGFTNQHSEVVGARIGAASA